MSSESTQSATQSNPADASELPPPGATEMDNYGAEARTTPSSQSIWTMATSNAVVTVTATETVEADASVISPAVAGGIGVGAALAGGILALALTLLFVRLKGNRRPHPILAQTTPVVKPEFSDQPSVLDLLPQQIADETLRQKMRRLSNDIKNCVDNYFPEASIQLIEEAEDALERLAGTPVDGSRWSDILAESKLRCYAIRLLIAKILFRQMGVDGYVGTTILSSNLPAVYQDLQIGSKDSNSLNASDRKELLSVWRQISGFLQPQESPERGHLRAMEISATLGPLRPEPFDGFRRNLEVLVKDAGQLGLEIFKTPDEWEITWTRPGGEERRGFVVFPGLTLIRRSRMKRLGNTEARVQIVSPMME